ncbi:uncharacterized protein PAM68-like [Cucumis sativus]|uniref:Uncharacterized protein n=1 Tax=Cucumis sativus TaxID=3659 RepID=A0A0A0LLM4_CUCSA|nr:uncharacterized protein PAM68-like [Cucumis sativus]KGN61652.1 hypothetical protein Csa_006286 [Cucumis sativus]
MKSLACSFPQALLLSNPPPWNQRTLIINHSTITNNLTNFTPTLSRGQVQVNAKGFTNSPRTAKNRETTAQNNNEDDDDEIPEAVYSRIITRILAFVGIPMAFGVTLLKIFQAIKEQNLWDVPIWVPFFTTFLTFGASTMGIAYGTLSTSLDPEKKGSVLGWEEAQKNWVEMWKEEDEGRR